MKMRKGKLLLLGAVVMSVLVALPVISGCAKAPPAGAEVVYLSLADYTGAIAGLNVPAEAGVQDYLADLNERGGVDGVKIRYLGVDTRYDTARAVSAYKRYRTEPNLFVVNMISTAAGKAIAPMTLKDKVIQLAPGDGEHQAHIGWVFVWGVCYQNAFGANIDFVVEDWKTKGNPGMPTIGYMCWDSAYGREPLRGGKEYAEQVGVNLLEPEYFPIGAPDHSVWLSRIADQDPDYCFIGGVDPTPSNILRDAYKLGLTETIQFLDATFWGPTEAVGIKLHPEATEGAWVCSYYIRGAECWEHPLAVMGQKRHPEVNLRDKYPGMYISGMGWGLLYEAALKVALDEVGYENLNGDVMLAAFESLTGQEFMQGIQSPCTYSPTSRQGSDMLKIYEVQNGKEVDISGWRKVPDCVSLHDFD